MRDPLPRVPIKYKLTAAFVGICFFAFGAGGYIISVTAGPSLEKEITLRLQTEADAMAGLLASQLQLMARRAEDFASDGFIRTQLAFLNGLPHGTAVDSRREYMQLREHLQRNKLPLVASLSDLLVCTQNGERILSVRGSEERFSRTVLMAGLRSDTLSISSFLRSTDGGESYLALSTPVRDMEESRVIGSLIFLVRMQDWLAVVLQRSSADGRGVGGNHSVIITDRDGMQYTVVGSREGARRRDGFVHDTRIAGFGWKVQVSVDAQQAMLPVSGLQSHFLGVAILVALVALVLLFFPVRFLIRPLSEMSEAARAMTEGDYSRRVQLGAEDEIGQLARSFNVMAEATQERTEKLRNTARLLEQRTMELAVERDVLDAVLHSMHDAVLFCDREGNVILQNAAGEALHRLLEEKDGSLLPRRCGCDEEKRDCRDCLRSGAAEMRDCYVDAGARVFEIITAGIRSATAPEGTLLVARDITTRMRIDERQAHRDRLAVLGEVSAVMAHELNNPLAAISMFTQLMSRDGQLLAKYGEHIEIIQRNTALCTRTIKDLLYYSRDSYRAEEECDLHEVIPDVIRFLRPLYERAELEFHLQFNLERAVLRCDTVHVRQVLVNLIMNALQATNGNGGRITVVTSQPTAQPEQVMVDIIDDGPGIPGELHEQVFEPFFTTKPSGEGTGLGLSISRRIVETLRGSLALHSSRPGETVFRIMLPRGREEG